MYSRYKEKSEIFHGFKYHIESEGATYRMTINKLAADDEGKYICSVNGVETFAYLTVTRKMNYKWVVVWSCRRIIMVSFRV